MLLLNMDPSHKEDEKLQHLLQEWKVNETVPPRFQERVWQRVEDAETPTRTSMSWFTALFMRPAFATVTATVLLLGGLAIGYVRANHDSAQWNEQLAHRYVALVNPYAHEQ